MGNIQLEHRIMSKFRPFRYWFYLRVGYQHYFAFVFAAINTMVITYFLAIERVPFLESVFPTFTIYAAFMVGLGIPILGLVGYMHFKKIPAFKSEQEVSVESNPFIYKLPPGHAKLVQYPWQLLLSKLLVKIANGEKISDEDIKKLDKIQKNMETLIEGGYVGVGKGQPFRNPKKD